MPFTVQPGPLYVEEDRGFDTPCWVWLRSVDKAGYGRIRRKGRGWGAHHWFYVQANGPVPAGMELDHLCRVRACVNPAHLEPVVRLDNVIRGARRRLTVEDRQAIRAAEGTATEVAARYGVCRSYVKNLWQGHLTVEDERAGVVPVARDRRRLRLTPELVREIRASSLSNVEWGQRLSIHDSVISRVRTGKIWTWVE